LAATYAKTGAEAMRRWHPSAWHPIKTDASFSGPSGKDADETK